MERWNKIIVLFIATCLLTACGRKTIHKEVEAKAPGYHTLQEMEKDCDVIVCVTRLEEERPVVTLMEGHLVSGYTFSQVRVEQIYQDKSGVLTENDTIRILENEVLSKEENVIYHIGGYHMMAAGKQYLLFLNQYTDSDKEFYYVAAGGGNFGTVSLEEDDRITRYQGEETVDTSYFTPIWEAAREKYASK